MRAIKGKPIKGKPIKGKPIKGIKVIQDLKVIEVKFR